MGRPPKDFKGAAADIIADFASAGPDSLFFGPQKDVQIKAVANTVKKLSTVIAQLQSDAEMLQDTMSEENREKLDNFVKLKKQLSAINTAIKLQDTFVASSKRNGSCARFAFYLMVKLARDCDYPSPCDCALREARAMHNFAVLLAIAIGGPGFLATYV